jgi:DNA-binding GntR family transcriptional regulator
VSADKSGTGEERPAADTEALRGVVRLPVHLDLVSRLRDAIIEGEFAEGSHLSERLLCERLGVSRSPLREALKTVAAEGLIELLPNRGARVVQLSIEQLRDTYSVVAILEIAAGRLACERATDMQIAELGELHFRMTKFRLQGSFREYFKTNLLIHEKIVEAAGNPVLLETYRAVSGRIRRSRFFSHQLPNPTGKGYQLLDESFSRSSEAHERIFEALRRRDADLLETLIRRHYSENGGLSRLEHSREKAKALDHDAEPDDWAAEEAVSNKQNYE